MLLRRLACAVAILGLSLGLAMADEIKGSITRIDEKKVTVVTGKKGEKKTTEYDIAKDCKFSKMEKKTKLDLSTLPGEEVETQIREVMNQPKDVIERVRKLSE